jgi:hypothetical protein
MDYDLVQDGGSGPPIMPIIRSYKSQFKTEAASNARTFVKVLELFQPIFVEGIDHETKISIEAGSDH